MLDDRVAVPFPPAGMCGDQWPSVVRTKCQRTRLVASRRRCRRRPYMCSGPAGTASATLIRWRGHNEVNRVDVLVEVATQHARASRRSRCALDMGVCVVAAARGGIFHDTRARDLMSGPQSLEFGGWRVLRPHHRRSRRHERSRGPREGAPAPATARIARQSIGDQA